MGYSCNPPQDSSDCLFYFYAGLIQNSKTFNSIQLHLERFIAHLFRTYSAGIPHLFRKYSAPIPMRDNFIPLYSALLRFMQSL
jgi:hypothetical protein